MEPNRLPNAIVAGAPKCGTSSLYFWLSAHPGVCPSPVKETFFFADDVNRFNREANILEHDLTAYGRYFEKCTHAAIRLEATAPYIYYEKALAHIPGLVISAQSALSFCVNPVHDSTVNTALNDFAQSAFKRIGRRIRPERSSVCTATTTITSKDGCGPWDLTAFT